MFYSVNKSCLLVIELKDRGENFKRCSSSE